MDATDEMDDVDEDAAEEMDAYCNRIIHYEKRKEIFYHCHDLPKIVKTKTL